jgi:hypothetical protein
MQSEPANIVLGILRNLLSHAPMLLISLGGLVLAFMNWGKWPRASLLLALGCGLNLLLGVGMPIVYGVLPHLFRGTSGIGTIYTVLSFVWGILAAAGSGLIILAVYAGRKTDATGPGTNG